MEPSAKKPGRPAGRTDRGEEMRRRLFDVAMNCFAKNGYESTSLAEIAEEAGVSTTLLYRYFPNKGALVLQLYDDLSADFAENLVLPSGNWVDRFHGALGASLEVLSSHRKTLSGLLSVLLGDPSEGLFSERTAFSRNRVQPIFVVAISEASDAPGGHLAEALGRTLYLLHLAIILWWLLDRSHQQQATDGLLQLVHRALPLVSWALMMPGTSSLIENFDSLAQRAFFEPTVPPL